MRRDGMLATNLLSRHRGVDASIARMREAIYNGLLANDIIGFHTRSYRRNFLQCCHDLLDFDVDMERGVVVCGGDQVGRLRVARERRLATEVHHHPQPRHARALEEVVPRQ